MKLSQTILTQWQSLRCLLIRPKRSRVEQMLAVKTEAERNREMGYLLIILIILL